MTNILVMQSTTSTINDQELLKEEIKEYSIITKGKLEPLLFKCAEKLIKADPSIDESTLSTRIGKIFPDQRRRIRQIFPDKWKRDYEQKAEEIPKTKLQELLDFKEQNFKTISDIIRDIRKKISNEKFNGLDKEIESALTKEKSLDELLIQEKELNSELSLIQSKTDMREKIHDFESLVLRSKMFVRSLHYVANIVDQTPKWQQVGVKPNAEELIKELDEREDLKRCVVCDWDSAEWFNKNLQRERDGLPIILPNVNDIKTGLASSKLIDEVASKTGLSSETVTNTLTEYFIRVKEKQKRNFKD